MPTTLVLTISIIVVIIILLVVFGVCKNSQMHRFMFFKWPSRPMAAAGAATAATAKPRKPFLTAAETAAFINSDADRYIYGLSRADLSARQVKTRPEYMARAAAAAVSFTEDEKKTLLRASAAADARFAAAGTALESRIGVDGRRAAAIPWHFAKTAAPAYEGGFPHTREDIIFLSTLDGMLGNTANAIDSADEDPLGLINLLIHEKVHLYSRGATTAPGFVAFLNRAGFRRRGRPAPWDCIRANPDTDGHMWTDPDGRFIFSQYASKMPAAITDVRGTAASAEHPYEMMAVLAPIII